MDSGQLQAIVDQLRAMAEEADKTGDSDRMSQLMTDAGKLKEWDRKGQPEPCPVDLEQYNLAEAASAVEGEAADEAAAPLAEGEATVSSEPTAVEEEPKTREDKLGDQLKRARITKDLEAEERALKALLELRPDHEELLKEWVSFEAKKDKAARHRRLSEVKKRLRDPEVQRDQGALEAALREAETLQADGETDAELLSLIKSGRERALKIAKEAEAWLSFQVTAKHEAEIRKLGEMIADGIEYLVTEKEGRVATAVLLGRAREQYGSYIRDRVNKRLQRAKDLEIEHPRKAREELEEAKQLLTQADEENLADIERKVGDEVEERLRELEERVAQWDKAHQAVEQTAQVDSPDARLKLLLLARQRYPEYVGPDNISLDDKIASAVVPVAVRAYGQMQRHLERARTLRGQLKFDQAIQSCHDGQRVKDELLPEAVTDDVRKLGEALDEELRHINAAQARLADLTRRVEAIDKLLEEGRFEEAQGPFEPLQKDFSDEPEVKRLEKALAGYRDRARVLTDARTGLTNRDPQHALDLINALKKRGLEDKETKAVEQEAEELRLFQQAQLREKEYEYRQALNLYRQVAEMEGVHQQEAVERAAEIETYMKDDDEVRGILEQVKTLEKEGSYKEACRLLRQAVGKRTCYFNEAKQKLSQLQGKWREKLLRAMEQALSEKDLPTAFDRAQELEENGLHRPLRDEVEAVKSKYYREAARQAARRKRWPEAVQSYRELQALRPRDQRVAEQLLTAEKNEAIQTAKKKPAPEAVRDLEELYNKFQEEGQPGDKGVLYALADAHRRALDFLQAEQDIDRYRRYNAISTLPRDFRKLEKRTVLEQGIFEDLERIEGQHGHPTFETTDLLMEAQNRFSGPPADFLSDELERVLNDTVDSTVSKLLNVADASRTSEGLLAQMEALSNLVWILNLQPENREAGRAVRRLVRQLPVLVDWALIGQERAQRLQGMSATEMLQETQEQILNAEVLQEAAKLTGLASHRDLPQRLQPLAQNLTSLEERRNKLQLMVELAAQTRDGLKNCRRRQDFGLLRQHLNDLQQIAVSGTTDPQELSAEIQDKQNLFSFVESKIADLQLVYRDYLDLKADGRFDLQQLVTRCRDQLGSVQSLCEEIIQKDEHDAFRLQQQMFTVTASLGGGGGVAVSSLTALKASADRELRNLNQWVEWHEKQWNPALGEFNNARGEWQEALDERTKLGKQLTKGLRAVRSYLGRRREHGVFSLAQATRYLDDLEATASDIADAYEDRPAEPNNVATEALETWIKDQKDAVDESLSTLAAHRQDLEKAKARLTELCKEITDVINRTDVDWGQADQLLAEALTIDPTHVDVQFYEEDWDQWKEEDGWVE